MSEFEPLVRGAGGTPHSITIERGRDLWRFVILNTEGECIDYSLGSTRGSVWRMARLSWRRADRKARQ